MPATAASINLLEGNGDDNSPFTRMVNWAVTYGRYIMIGTEIVVLLAFISRFSLDRKLTDLKEEITQKQAILQANIGLEKEIKDFQNSTATIQKLLQGQDLPVRILEVIQTNLPDGAFISSLNYEAGGISITVTTPTNETFAQILANFSANPLLTNVSIGGVTKHPIAGIQFTITTDVAGAKKEVTEKAEPINPPIGETTEEPISE